MFPAASDVIIADLVQFLLVLPVDRVTFSKEHCVGGHNPEFLRLASYYLELYWFEVTPHNEQIPLFDWPVRVFEVWNQIALGKIPRDPLNSVSYGQDVNFGKIRNLPGCPDLDHVSQPNSQILPDRLVHSDLPLF